MPCAIVTGGTGFIGSHLTMRLVQDGYDVTVLDNMSCGKEANLSRCDLTKTTVHNIDLTDYSTAIQEFSGDVDIVFHFAADPEVRSSITDPGSHYYNNVQATYNVLEAMRLNDIPHLVFASSSVVYGDAEIMPTPEEYAFKPISIYGSTKLACEVLIQGYVESFNMDALILRPANIIGSNGTHGVILDFINKLLSNPQQLDILGDGTQCKSYLHVTDCVEAILIAHQHCKTNGIKVGIFNIGNHDATDVKEIAQIVSEEMDLQNVSFNLTGGSTGGRGWKGDVKKNLLSITKLLELGWQPVYNSSTSVRVSTSELISEFKNRQLGPA